MLVQSEFLLAAQPAIVSTQKSQASSATPLPQSPARAPAQNESARDAAAEVSASNYDSIAAAVAAMGEKERTLVISDARSVATNLIIPPGITLRFVGDGALTLSAGSVRINGAIEAGARSIFQGAGKITFGDLIPEVYPEWFGATGNGESDDTDAFTKLRDALPTSEAKWSKVKGVRSYKATLVRLGNKTYRLTSQILLGNNRHIRFQGHAPYSARFLWDGLDKGNYMFRYTARNNSHIMFENVIFHRGGVEIDAANRGYKVFQRVMWEDTRDYALRTNGRSVIGMLIDEFWVTNCAGGINIGYDQSDLIHIRRGNFTRNFGIPIVLKSSGITVELCDFETSDVSGTKYENPYLHIAAIGRVRIVRNRFGNEHFGPYAHPREAIVIGASLNSFTDGTIINVQLLENEFLGYSAASATLANNGIKLTQKNAGLVITNNGRIQNYFGKFVNEFFMSGGGDASTVGNNITDLGRGSFTHGGLGFTFTGGGSVGNTLAVERFRPSQNLLKGTSNLDGWTTTKSVNLTLTTATTAPDDSTDGVVKLTRTEKGAAYARMLSEPLPAGTSNLVFSIWAKAGTAQIMRLTVGAGTNKLLTSANPRITLGNNWRRYYITVPTVLDATQVYAYINLGAQGEKESGGDFYVYGPQLEAGLTPTEYIPSTPAGVHAGKQLQSQMLGTSYIGYGASAPTSGRYRAGDIIYNTAPRAGGFVGWICIEGGAPGSWRTFGSIAP